MPSSERRIISRAPHVGWVGAADGVYVVVPAESRPFSVIKLSQTGKSIWDIVDGHTSLADVIDLTAAEWNVDPSEIGGAVKAFVQSLVAQGILIDRRG